MAMTASVPEYDCSSTNLKLKILSDNKTCADKEGTGPYNTLDCEHSFMYYVKNIFNLAS